MDTAMDTMEIDIDLGDPIDEQEALLVAAQDQQQAAQEPLAPAGSADEVVPNKIHIRGVDELSTANIQAFSQEHFPDQKPSIEWIDDTSVNLVFESPEAAQQALLAFSSHVMGDASGLHHLQLREAKPLTSHPEAKLQVRTAIITDKKKPRAREASRYYLMHPEEDPGDRRRSQKPQRRRRRSDDEVETFDASMYDDDGGEAVARRHGRDGQRNRDRSASPGREGSRSGYRRRSRDRGRGGRDLFDKSEDHGSILRGTASKELFPAAVKAARNKDAAGSLKKELFPVKAGSAADSAADLFSSKMTVPLTDGARDHDDGSAEPDFPLRSDAMYQQQRKNLTISGKEAPGFSIRGAAGAPDGDQGFSIRGSAGQKKSIKELFPESKGSANAGKELFGGRAKRNKAADLFG